MNGDEEDKITVRQAGMRMGRCQEGMGIKWWDGAVMGTKYFTVSSTILYTEVAVAILWDKFVLAA